ncbi:hypothetical protein POM88_026301 [Heracleum sosnowskyi]|uniref:Endonuclease/exonuclease/phosphatase domain-containing protein n=1 Tax=Heracleum sosnowskyi TaxID=360622 RepID=A0AAD8I7V9_9APIA|nr:hypothetical protein POM88_026301 [Heracleum sosnowskyi]
MRYPVDTETCYTLSTTGDIAQKFFELMKNDELETLISQGIGFDKDGNFEVLDEVSHMYTDSMMEHCKALHGADYVECEGFSGGLLTSWDKDLFEEVGVKTNKNWLWISLRSKNTGVKFHCVNIYALQEPREKREVWKALSIEFMKDELDPVCFMGDFNAIRSIEERKDCSYRRADTHDFNKFIKDLNLLEIPMSNDSFKLEKF